jgi:hypothetical protein
MRGAVLAATALTAPAARAAATLPPHDALRMPIISDEVNPHGLPRLVRLRLDRHRLPLGRRERRRRPRQVLFYRVEP